jgi:hypothetical protein
MITGDQWDWSLETCPVPEQLATTVYFNQRGEVVIRQKADVYDDGDTLVLLAPENAGRLANALLELIGEMPTDATTSKDRTAAERQRRRRDRQRDAAVTVTDGNRDSEFETLPMEKTQQLLLAAE